MTLRQFIGLIILLASIAGVAWMYWYALKNSDDPKLILFKTILTLVSIVGMGFVITPIMRAGGYGAAFGGIPLTVAFGVFIAIIWRQHIANAVARPFENLFTGGSAPPEPEPFYSIAITRRRQSKFEEAIALIEEQLTLFPNDFNGLMLMAEIQAENQHNLSGAAETIERICRTPKAGPRNIASALTALADWHLKIYRDRDAALAALERIRNQFPNSSVAQEAAQRIAHLPSEDMLEQKTEPRRITLAPREPAAGREPSRIVVERPEESPDEAIARLAGQVELHPTDRTAREELADLYAEHLHDLPLAIEQFEFLIRQPSQNKHLVIKWLNRMVDLQVRYGTDPVPPAKTLDRIINRYPGSPAAEQAAKRKMLLKIEMQGKEKSRDVTLGSYEKDLGLR